MAEDKGRIYSSERGVTYTKDNDNCTRQFNKH